MCNSCFPIRRRSSVHPEFVQPTTKTIQTKNVYDCAEALNSNLEMIMRLRVLFGSVVVLGLLTWQAGTAQAPAGAPSGSTGQCNDGTYSSAPSKRGACRGHQGVKTWFATTSTSAPASTTAAPAPAPAAAPAPTPAPAPAPASAPAPAAPRASTSASTKTPVAGGGPGLVWLNTSTNVYHCYGTRYYGTTKAGKYVSEADAKAAGAHADHGKACSQ
jgi:hypothetical protein